MMLERYGSWMDSLPAPAHQCIPDMAHIEVFAPAAPNNVYYAFDRSFYINPFNDRQILHQTMRFHPIARMKRKLVNGLIGRCMPDIVDLPYVSFYKALFREAEEKGLILRPEL